MTILKKLSLAHKVVGMMICSCIALTIVLTVTTYSNLTQNVQRLAIERQESNMRVAWDILRSYGLNFHLEDGHLYAGDRALNSFYAPVDDIKRLVGGTATIFMGDKRISTNVLKADGERAVGTALQPGPAYEQVLKQGRSYRGEAEILGRPFFVQYDPIKDAAGQVIGILFVGIPQAEFFAPIEATQRWTMLISVVAALVISFLSLLAANRMFRPLDRIRDALDRLRQGETDVELPWAGRADDIGRMAQAVMTLRDSNIEKNRMGIEAAAVLRQTEDERRLNQEQRDIAEQAQGYVVEALAEGLERLSGGDLTYRIKGPFDPRHEKLRADFNAAVEQLESTMSAVVETSNAIRASADEATRAADDLSQRSEQQAALMDETAKALDEITATVSQYSQGSGAAQATVSVAKVDAERGGGVVREAIDAMSGIESSSRKISQFISMIDEISFQTNLLALNAGVEAARAGETGRGFAVVAAEVRALALRSADAAREIKALISESSRQVDAGVELVGLTGESLSKIGVEVTEINNLVGEIAASAKAQSLGLQEVNKAMSQVTRQNAALVRNNNSANRTLARQAEELGERVSRFQVGRRKPLSFAAA